MAAPRRVLHVINSSEEGGGARHLEALVSGAAPRFEPVVATAAAGPLVGRLAAAGVRVARVEMMRSRLDPRPALVLRSLLARERFDLVHLHGTRAGFFGTLAAATLAPRPRIVYTVHGLACSRRAPAPVRALLGRCERFIAGRADRVISVSERDRRFAVDAGILPADRTCTIRNGIDADRMPEPRRPPFADPSAAGVLTVARLVPQKGIDVLLDAAAVVLRSHPEARFAVLGEGPRRGELEARAARLGIADRVALRGAGDAGRALGCCDLFVLPSLWEGMPLSLLVAMALGRPVVATAASGSAEIVLDGETGLLVPPGDPGALADAVGRLLDDPAAAAAMGARGRERVRREFRADRMVASTCALYDGLLAEAASAAVAAGAVRLT